MGVLKQAEGGVPVAALCREHGMSTASFYKWDGRALRLLNVLDCQIASNSDPLFASNFDPSGRQYGMAYTNSYMPRST